MVNVARGGLLNYQSTLHSLESGHLGGLGIDVAWTEPFDPNDPILKFNNVIITPHVAGVTEHAYRSMAKVFYWYCFLNFMATLVLFIVSSIMQYLSLSMRSL